MPTRVLPSGTTDYTSQIAAREAAANDALTRLYISLAARKEERLRQQEFLEKMLGLKHEYMDKTYEKWGPPGGRNPNFTGWSPPVDSGDSDNPLADKSGATTGAAAPQAPTQKAPKYYGPNPDAFTPEPQKSGALPIEAISAYAQAPSSQLPDKGETTTLSGQGVFTNKPQHPMRTTGSKSTAVKREDYRYIGPSTIASWTEAEKRNKLPPGTLLTVLGLENDGGYKLGANPRSRGGASGLFQMTPEQRREMGMSESDQLNPVKAGDAIAAYIARSKANIERMTKTPIGDSPKDMAWLYMGHHWGPGNAPRIKYAYEADPNTPLRKVLMPSRAKDGSVVTPEQTMANNGIPLDASVKSYLEGSLFPRVQQWQGKAVVRLQNQPVAPSEIPRNTTGVAVGTPQGGVPQGANFAGRGAGAQYRFGDTANMVAIPVPDGSGRTVVMHKDVAPIVHGFLKDMRDAGAPMGSLGGFVPKRISGTRTPSQHGFGFALDYMQKGRNQVSAEFRDWAVKNKDTLGGILAKWKIRSGGDWRNPDFGHFEFGPEALANYQRLQAQPKVATAPAAPSPVEQQQMKPSNYDTTGKGAFMGVTAGMQSAGKSTPLVDPNIVFDPSMRKPQTQMAAPVTPTVVPKTAAINPEQSAAVALPTPQTASTVEQKTQTPPAPTPQQTQVDTALDPDEHAATRLSTGEAIPIPRARPEAGTETVDPRSVLDRASDTVYNAANDIAWAAGDIGSKIISPIAGAVRPDPRYTDPAYVESQQGFDEAGMEGVQNYVTPEAVPGEGTRGLVSGANDIIQSIQQKAKEYSALQAGRNEARQLEQVYNYPQVQAPAAPTVQPQPQQPNVDELIRARQLDEIRRRMMPADSPQYKEPPQQQPTLPPPTAATANAVPSTAPLPVPASDVADAMYNVGEGIPSYGQVAGAGASDGMSWIERLFHRAPDTSPVKPNPVKPIGIKNTPGGTPYILPTPLPEIGGATGLPIQPMPSGVAQPQGGQVIIDRDAEGNPILKMVE